MERHGWKIFAIILLILFLLETSLMIFGMYLNEKDKDKMNTCYYDICTEYPEAYIVDDICICYQYDLLDNLQIAKQVYIK